MLIDDFLPKFDVREHHSVKVKAPVDQVYRTMSDLDLSHARLSMFLFRLRGMCGAPAFNLDELLKMGFIRLGNEPNEELLLGLVGRFWTPSGGIRRLDAEGFRSFDEPGYARAVWNFSLTEHTAYTTLETETRVQCTDDSSRKRFLRYWRIVGRFSGLIRRDILSSIKRSAEKHR
ncbi:MAG: hypothetical protein QOJ64_2321 [Acidobacteriota bacterium]|jgi:hypothetical protein|nr:hypothetical protein [Acidobacteriota bacterium]